MTTKQLLFLCIIIAFIPGCGGASPNTPTDIPVALEGADGATDIATNSSFTYTFDKAVVTNTVTTDTFCIVVGDASSEEDICDSEDALAATVTCGTDTECTLDPTSDLAPSTIHTVRLEGESASADISKLFLKADGDNVIMHADGTTFEGDTIVITTASGTTSAECSETFSGECNWGGSDEQPVDGDTFSFSDSIEASSETSALCVCELALDDGFSECIPYTESYYERCGLDDSSSYSGNSLAWDSGVADEDIVTLNTLTSDNFAFTSGVALYTEQTNFDSVYYTLDGAVEWPDTRQVGDDLCPVQTSCTNQFTEADVGSVIIALEDGITAGNWPTVNRCIRIVLAWNVYGLPNEEGPTSIEAITVNFQSSEGNCP